MVRLVIPMGNTSNNHHVPARRNIAKAPLPSLLNTKCSPIGSTASGSGGA